MTCRWNAKLSDSFSDLFGRYVPAHIEGGFVPLYCCYSRHCLVPCGVRSVATTKQRVKILCFKHFFKHFVFIENRDFDIKKVQKKYIDVNVCLDVDCVDKK